MTTRPGASVHVLDVPARPDPARLAGRLRMPRGSERLREAAADLVRRAVAAARPRALYRAASSRVIDRDTVEVEGVRLQSRALSRNLAGGPTVYPFLATIGRELDEFSLPPGSLTLNFYLDTVKNAVLMTAVDYLGVRIKQEYGLAGAAHMNPGEIPDWPIGEQAPLFSLFGGREKDIGVALTPSGVMKPIKSRSGIIFPDETGFLTCFLCTQARCPGRRARYDEDKVREYLGGGA
jgi:hypothetical protein